MTRNGTEQAIAEHLFRYYGLKGTLSRLAGENLNYRVDTETGERFVFKIVGEDEPEGVSEMEYALLEHARNAGFPHELPTIVKTYGKRFETGIEIRKKGIYRSRLMRFIDGELLENISDISDILLKNCGKILAEFDRALQGFDHPAAHRAGHWELPQAGRHRGKLAFIEDPESRDRVAWAFDQWEGIQDRLNVLPRQMIHGDANKENILVSGDRVSGLVDFGDACFNPRICELAICLAYLMMDRDDPVDAAAMVIGGYCEEIPLLNEELGVLYQLVCGRLAVTICVACARMKTEPDNANLFVSLKPAMDLLEKLQGMGVSRLY